MFEFNPRSPYHRRMWHYESDRPLSVAQLIARGSLDPRTAALLWLLVERHRSVIVSGPTDPTPGIGKTTTLNALLGFLPAGSTLVYTMGMFEDFAFKDEVDPGTTCVLANEVSNHLRIYMWGRVARTLLRLPQEGYAIATSCHADTITDVLSMLRDDLRLDANDVSHLPVIVNIGLVGRLWPPKRRFLTVNFVLPTDDDRVEGQRLGHDVQGVRLLPLSTWVQHTDSFVTAGENELCLLARVLGMPAEELTATLNAREELLARLAEGNGVGVSAMRNAVDSFVGLSTDGADASTADEDKLDEDDE